jgi:hypothetical protein
MAEPTPAPQPYGPAQPAAVPTVPVQTANGKIVPSPVASAPVQQPVAPPAPAPQPVRQTAGQLNREAEHDLAIRIYSHSNLFYWWPVWACGFVMAFLTWTSGINVDIGGMRERFHPNSSYGVIFFLVLFLTILVTNVSVRGLASGMVVLSIVLVCVLLAYFELWNTILNWFGMLRIHLNMGAYLSFSILLFLAWFFTVFVFDRMSYWIIKPGQITHEAVLGAGSKSYDTQGMALEKHRYDLFKNWIIGLGSGDLVIQTWGATRDRIEIPNVLFLGTKVEAIERMIAMRPEEFGNVAMQ